MKVGRNEPCPCGSGRKYKVCCLGREVGPEVAKETPARSPREMPSAREVGADIDRMFGGHVMSPYTVMRISEDPSVAKDERLRAVWEQGLRVSWTVGRVAALPTEEIEGRLRSFGVDPSRERFVELAKDRDSAWTISDVWRREAGSRCVGGEEDFLGLAACELWKRHLPDRPSTEMIDDWMQEGYALAGRGDTIAACDLWWKVWCLLRARFRPETTTMTAAEEVFLGMQSVYNWAQDFESGLRDASSRSLVHAAIGRLLCEEWIDQFTEEESLMQVNFRGALAGFLCLLGHRSRAEAVLLQAVEWWPDNVWGYVFAADAFSHFFPEYRTLDYDPERAVDFLRTALSIPGLDDSDRETVEDRIRDIRERNAKGGGPARS